MVLIFIFQITLGTGLLTGICLCLAARRRKALSRFHHPARLSISTAKRSCIFGPCLRQALKGGCRNTLQSIWTIDNSGSIPSRALDCTGTPKTGRWVMMRQSCQCRWAAPPAPAIITSKPSSAAWRCETCQPVTRAMGKR